MSTSWPGTETPSAPQSSSSGWPGSEVPDQEPSAAAKSTITNMVKTAPGIDKATNWFDALAAGMQMSAEGQLIRGGKPSDYQVPANASFGMKLMEGIGGFAGDLPIGIVGAIGGASAGGAAGTAAGGPVGGAIGAPVGGGAGAFALPEAVRQAAQDAYKLNQNGAHMTASDIFHMAAHSAWETGKAGAIGAVSGVAGKVAEVASPVWKSAASMAAFSTTATSAQAALNHKLPDQADVALTVASTLGFGLGAHYVGTATAPKIELTPTGEAMAHNLNEGYRQTGLIPNEMVKEAAGDPKKNDEIYGQDVNGDPVLTKFNQERPAEAKPYQTSKKPANGLVVARQMPDGTIKYGQPGDMHFNLYEDHELEQKAIGSVSIDQKDMGFAQPGGPFMSREEAAKFIGQTGRLESVKNEASAAGEQIPAFGKKNAAQAAPAEPPPFDRDDEKSVADHVEQMMPQIRGIMGAKDDAISPTGAVGRYQVLPGTARQYGFDPSKLQEPAYNEQVARTVLADLSRRFNGDTEAIIYAYNKGARQTFGFLRNGRDTTNEDSTTQNIMLTAGFGGKGGEPPKPPNRPQLEDNHTAPDRPGMSSVAAVDYDTMLGEQSPVKVTGRGIMRQMVSELESARGIDKIAITQGLLDPKQDMTAEDMFRQTYGSEGRASYFINKGAIDPITFEAKPGTSLLGDDGVIPNLMEAGGNLHDFNLYRIAQRTVDLAARGIDMGIVQLKDAKAVLADRDFAKYEPINAKMQMWKRGPLEYGRDSGMFSQKQIDAMEAASSHVSIRRIMGDDDSFSAGNNGGQGFRVRNPLLKMEGSNRQITEPLMADIDNARLIIRMADRNRAIGHVLSTPSLVKALGLRRVNVAGAAIAEPGSNVFKPYSMTPPQEEAFSGLAHMKAYDEKTPNSFTYFNKGKKELWVADRPEIAELMRGADSKISEITMNVLGHDVEISKLFGLPAAVQRAGIVGAFDFPLRVFQKHALTAWALDPTSPPPIITGARGLVDAFTKGEGYWDLARRGGLVHFGIETDIMNDVNKALGDQFVLNKTGALQKAWNVAVSPLHAMQMANEMLANAERIGYVKRAGTLGIDPVKATTSSRATFLDFNERAVNAAGRWLAQNIPFFKSETLGLKQTRNGWNIDAPGVFKKAIVGLVGTQVALYALNRLADQHTDDPTQRYTSQPQYERDQYPFQFPVPNALGGFTRIKLGAPYVIGPMISVPVNRMLEAIIEKDPHALDSFLGSFTSDAVPGVIPASVRPILETITNHNFFTGQPLISDSLKGRTADEQYTDNTSEAAVAASRIISEHRGILSKDGIGMDVSPIVTEQFVRDWAGTWGVGVLHALDAPFGKSSDLRDWKDSMFVKGFVIQNPRMNTQQLDDFYKDADTWNRLHADAVAEIKAGDPQGISDKTMVGRTTVMIQKFDHALNVVRQAVSAVEGHKDMSVDEKRQLANRLYVDAWHIATTGSKLLRQGASNDDLDQLNQNLTNDVEKAMPNAVQ